MKIKVALSLVIAFLAACDESTTENITQVNQVGVDVVGSVKDLPKCTAENEGDQAFVKGEKSARICIGKDWVQMSSSTVDTVYLAGTSDTVYLAGGTDTIYSEVPDFSCKTEELADESGLKLVCNGDSVGVLLNGTKGENGDPGNPGEPGTAGVGCSVTGKTDSTVIIACGEQSTTIQYVYSDDKPLLNFFQKGFFVEGTSVNLHELSDGHTLKQTGNVVSDKLVLDNGEIKFRVQSLVSQYVLFTFDGFYRNVVTGQLSEAPIGLKMLSDVLSRKTVNANPLAYLEYERVYYLVTKESLRVKVAEHQAQKEIWEQFHLDTLNMKVAEDITMFDTTAASAKLLALTILLQGDRSEVEFLELMTAISNDISTDGKWNDSNKKKEIATWAKKADESGRLEQIRKNVTKDGNSPDFIKYIRLFWNAELKK